MSLAAKGLLRLQYFIGRAGILVLAPAYFLFMRAMGYRVRGVKDVRKACARAFAKHRGPWIICANHLTMVDSMILAYALFSLPAHLTGFRLLPWNLPERDNFQRNIFLAVLCYLAKCIPVNRGGDREQMKKTLDKCDDVLNSGQNLLIFPEGGRSRTGRVNTEGFSYGVGRFIKEFEACRILCVYLRGDGQETFSGMPRFGETFTVKLEVFVPQKAAGNGLRAQRDYAGQIITRLAEMEEGYFASRRERHHRLDRSGKSRKEPEYTLHQPRLHRG